MEPTRVFKFHELKALALVARARSEDQNRIQLTGVYLHYDPVRIKYRIVATDGKLLAFACIEWEGSAADVDTRVDKVLISPEIISHLKKLFSPERNSYGIHAKRGIHGGYLEVTPTRSKLAIHNGNGVTNVEALHLEGCYPDYSAAFPKKLEVCGGNYDPELLIRASNIVERRVFSWDLWSEASLRPGWICGNNGVCCAVMPLVMDSKSVPKVPEGLFQLFGLKKGEAT